MGLWSGGPGLDPDTTQLNNYFKITINRWINPPSTKPLFGLQLRVYDKNESKKKDY